MRYRELSTKSSWRHYSGGERICYLQSTSDGSTKSVEVHVQYGSVATGRQRVWVGYFVQVVHPDERSWLEEHPYSLCGALRGVEVKLNIEGLSLSAVGLDPEWRESGLSANSGFGFHPDFDAAVHMLNPNQPISTIR